VNNPADGSYYIERSPVNWPKRHWCYSKTSRKQVVSKTIERRGHQKKIQESADKEQELFDSGKEVLLGTNKYPNKTTNET
jgi:methylmalonyl-CoA mutase